MITETRVPCQQCPLRKNPSFAPFSKELLAFTLSQKRGELRAGSGASVLQEGAGSPHLYTLLEGWGYRYKSLADGRRQILSYIFPGDFIGLQSTLAETMEHSVRTLGPAVFCIFDRKSFRAIYRSAGDVAHQIIWLAAREEQVLEEHLLSIGRRTAYERTAYLLAFLLDRGKATGLISGDRLPASLTQQHLADTLGLSVVHTNKTLRKLRERRLVAWTTEGCRISDAAVLRREAKWKGLPGAPRPLI